MNFLYILLEIWAILTGKKNLNHPKKIGILFLPKLGIGDLIMLSPVIQKIADLFPQSEVYLVTWVAPLIDFKNVKVLQPKEVKLAKIKFDFIISPTLTLRHIPYVFRAQYWLGYFAKPKLQANFCIKKYSYSLRGEHYLWRGINLIKVLNQEEGDKLERAAIDRAIVYPELLTKKPSYFDSALDGFTYLALAPFSKWSAKQWPIKWFAEVTEFLLKNGQIRKIVILGDNSEHDRLALARFLEYLPDYIKDKTINAVGKNTLAETSFIIKNSFLFIGLDSAPAHIAYLTAPRILAIFIITDPLNIIALTTNRGRITYLHPSNCPKFPCYSGLAMSDYHQCQICAQSITVDKVSKEIQALLNG